MLHSGNRRRGADETVNGAEGDQSFAYRAPSSGQKLRHWCVIIESSEPVPRGGRIHVLLKRSRKKT
jgi:hypothetical protein